MARTLHPSLTETQYFLGFFLLAVFLWFIALGDLPLRDWDEGTRGLIAREIYRSGDWLYPKLQGKPYLLKPPLMDWLIALSYKLWGVGEFTTRLPGAFSSACGVPLLYFVGRELFRQRLPAVLAASVYLTLLPVVRHGRLAMLDGMVVTFFLLLIGCLLKARQDRRWAVGIGISLGLIAFTKGILVLLLGAIAFLFLLADNQLVLLRSRYFWIGILFGTTPVIAWYIAQWQHYGATFWEVHIQAQGLARVSESVEGNSGSPGYYVWELLKYSLPWLFFWFGGLVLAWKNRRKSWGSLVLIGTVGYLGSISIMGTKLPWYIMPLYPFFALAVGAKLAQLWKTNKNYPQILVWIFCVISIAALTGCVYFVLSNPQPVLISMALVVSLTMGLVAWHIQQHKRIFIPIILVGMYLTLVLFMTSKSWIWELNEAFPVKPVAALIREQTPPDTAVYTSFEYRRPSLDFYSDRQVIPAKKSTLRKFRSKAYLLLDQPNLEALKLPKRRILGTAGSFILVAPKSTP